MDPSQSLFVQGGSTRPRVAVGESHSKNTHQGGPVDEEIVSAIRLQGHVIELSSSVKKRLVKMLLDLGATSTFISDAMATALKLQIQDDEDFHELTLADGIVVSTKGYVQFMMTCGDAQTRLHPTVDIPLWSTGVVCTEEGWRSEILY